MAKIKNKTEEDMQRIMEERPTCVVVKEGKNQEKISVQFLEGDRFDIFEKILIYYPNQESSGRYILPIDRSMLTVVYNQMIKKGIRDVSVPPNNHIRFKILDDGQLVIGLNKNSLHPRISIISTTVEKFEEIAVILGISSAS